MKRFQLLIAVSMIIIPLINLTDLSAGWTEHNCTKSFVSQMEIWEQAAEFLKYKKISSNKNERQIIENILHAIEKRYLGLYIDAASGGALIWAPMGDALHFIVTPPSLYLEDQNFMNDLLSAISKICSRSFPDLGSSWVITTVELEIRHGMNPECDIKAVLSNRSDGRVLERSFRGQL